VPTALRVAPAFFFPGIHFTAENIRNPSNSAGFGLLEEADSLSTVSSSA
jgi:hypothetical protein